MKLRYDATIQDGTLQLDGPIELPSGTRVQVILTPLPTESERQQAWDEFDRLCDEIHIHSNEPHLTRDQLHERR